MLGRRLALSRKQGRVILCREERGQSTPFLGELPGRARLGMVWEEGKNESHFCGSGPVGLAMN